MQTQHTSNLRNKWFYWSLILIGLTLAFRLYYIGSDTIELSEDEAYQWVWSKHPALSYYSKPLMIAMTQLAGTTLWGDTAFGVRFFSPVIGALIGLLSVCFLTRHLNAKAGFATLCILITVPILSVGSTLMTIDPLTVLFWWAGAILGWYAIQKDSTMLWIATGIMMGLGFLSKFIAPLQIAGWILLFIIWPESRKQIRRPGPYLALLLTLLSTLPVIIWNAQNDWITFHHLHERGGLDKVWKFKPDYMIDFILNELALWNPIYFVGAIWAAIAMWRNKQRTPVQLFLFSMSAPVFLFYFLLTIRSRVLPNWIAVSIVPLLCLMVTFWYPRWEQGQKKIKGWFVAAIVIGILAIIPIHNTDFLYAIPDQWVPTALKEKLGRSFPAKIDPLRRVRCWSDMGAIVAKHRDELLKEGKPVFVLGGHYGIAGQLSFYIPDSRDGLPDDQIVYRTPSDIPKDQFYFWPGFQSRTGDNALYVENLKFDDPEPVPGWLNEYFESVTDLGVTEIIYKDYLMRKVRVIACRNLREVEKKESD